MNKITLGIISIFLFGSLSACHHVSNDNSSASDSSSLSTNQPPASRALVGNALLAVPTNAKVFFANLKDGQTVTSPVKVEMGVVGMSVDTAGKIKAGSGHHHILIDAGDSITMGTTIPADAHHLHFGKAQTETELTLSPGVHRLTLQFADGLHRSYGSQMASSITVKVK
ncbi:MAG: DUF4399 domain-containing protein [Chitinophagaceae bacterium]